MSTSLTRVERYIPMHASWPDASAISRLRQSANNPTTDHLCIKLAEQMCAGVDISSFQQISASCPFPIDLLIPSADGNCCPCMWTSSSERLSDEAKHLHQAMVDTLETGHYNRISNQIPLSSNHQDSSCLEFVMGRACRLVIIINQETQERR